MRLQPRTITSTNSNHSSLQLSMTMAISNNTLATLRHRILEFRLLRPTNSRKFKLLQSEHINRVLNLITRRLSLLNKKKSLAWQLLCGEVTSQLFSRTQPCPLRRTPQEVLLMILIKEVKWRQRQEVMELTRLNPRQILMLSQATTSTTDSLSPNRAI